MSSRAPHMAGKHGGRTYDFDFDRVPPVVGHEHAQPMVKRLIPRAEMRQHERHIDRLVVRLEHEVVRGQRPRPAVFHAMRTMGIFEQTLCARRC